MFEDPGRDLVEGDGRDGFFDLGVFVGRPGLGGLEEMVQTWEFDRFKVSVAGGLKGLADGWEVLSRWNLRVFGTIESKYGARDFAESDGRVVLQKVLKPG